MHRKTSTHKRIISACIDRRQDSQCDVQPLPCGQLSWPALSLVTDAAGLIGGHGLHDGMALRALIVID